MTSFTDLADEVKAAWRQGRPHNRHFWRQCGVAAVCVVAIIAISSIPSFPRWLSGLLVFAPIVYVARSALIAFAADAKWELEEKNSKLEKQLTSPDLNKRFEALSVRLRLNDKKELEHLQEIVQYGAREALRLAEEIDKYGGITEAIRQQQEADRKSAQALAHMLDSQIARVAEMIERKGRPGQWLFLILGAILGVAVQALAQWIF
jgi:hypothetical protein